MAATLIPRPRDPHTVRTAPPASGDHGFVRCAGGADGHLRPIMIIGALLLFLAFGALTIVGGRGGFADLAAVQSEAGEMAAAGEVVRVEAGDTVWGIARRLQPDGDVRPLVDRIITLNGGAHLQAGQLLRLPD